MRARASLRFSHGAACVAGLFIYAVVCCGCRSQQATLPSSSRALSVIQPGREATPRLTLPAPSVTPTLTALLTRAAPATVTATRVLSRAPTGTAPTPEIIRAKIEIVWPHGGAPVREADLANITAFLSTASGKDPPPCDWNPTVRLWSSLNTAPARPIATGEKRMFSTNGGRFPVWDFNDIDVSAARDAANKLAFFVTVDGVETLHNIWVHAADARTIFPQQDVPKGAVNTRPSAVDAQIEIVWPHDSAPIEQAELANITGYLFVPKTRQAFAPGIAWSPVVRLHRSLNAETEAPGTDVVGSARTVVTSTGLSFLAWDFNDVDVSAAQDPLNQVFFWMSVDGGATFPNVWAHATEARTLFPQPDILSSCK